MIAKFSVKKPFTILVGVILVIVLGVVSLTKMSTDLLPNINLPYVVVMTTYVGATPETVEKVVTAPVESAMATVSNIENVNSISAENYSVVILEFAQTADMDSASLEIRESLDQLKSYWDDSVGNPVIMKLNPDMLPIMIATVGVDTMNETEVSKYAEEEIMPELESIEGVASVTATGLIENSVHVVIREDKLDALNVAIRQSIDEKMQEAYDKLKDAEAEIRTNETKLTNAQNDLNKGKNEINNGLNQVNSGRNELKNKQNQSTAELAAAELQLLTAKADLESAKTTIQTNLTTVDTLVKTRDTATTNRNSIQTLQTALLVPATETYLKTSVPAAISGYQADPLIDHQADLDSLKQSLLNNPLLLDNAKASIRALDFSQSNTGLVASYTTIINGYYTYVATTLATLNTTITNLNDQINSLTFGQSVDVYKAQQNGIIGTINGNINTVDTNIKKVYEGDMQAAISFASGLSSLDLNQYKLEQAQKEITSGQEELDAAKKQIDDAKEQLEEGKKELEESKQEAYEKADIFEILTVDMVSSILGAQNFSMPAGYIEEEGTKYLVRIGNRPETVEDMNSLPIMEMPLEKGKVITLADIADVFTTNNEDLVYSNVNGERGIVLSIQKQTGYSTGDVSDKLKAKFESLQKSNQDLTLIALMDQGIYIDLVMDTIISNVLIGGLLAILILIFFLRDIRPTLVIAISIPVSLITAIVCMYFSGVTLNIISLSGLALGVGMLVDNSIVVIENIYRLRNSGVPMKQAAIEGAQQVAGAIAASTLTTVCVFVPIVFTEGITRQLFVDMGLTIAYSLLASLVIALTVVPAMASVTLRKPARNANKGPGIFSRAYEKILRFCLKAKVLVFIVVIGLLAASIYAALSRGTVYFPDMDSTQISVTVSLSEDAKQKDVTKDADALIEKIMTMEDVIDVGAMASSAESSLLGGMSTSDGPVDSVGIYITTKEHRKLSADELSEKIHNFAQGMDGIEVLVETSTMDMSALGGSGISLEVRGRDTDVLQKLAKEAAAVLEATEGTMNVSDGTNHSIPELRVIVDKEKAITHNLTIAQVYAAIYPKLSDAKVASSLETATEDISIYVESGENLNYTRDQLKDLQISYKDAEGKSGKVALKDIASFEEADGLNSIRRVSQTRYLSVTAELEAGYNIGLVSQRVEESMKNVDVPEGYQIVFTGENERINDALQQLVLMLILAVIFIYLIMVAQFQSLLSPFIIMFTMPLAFTGGFAALYFTGNEISIVSMIGFVMLSGIIVNNGIVLVDYINRQRILGMSKKEAIIDAGLTRIRPVMMTALTTILALLTMAFSSQMGADMSRPLAIVTIGGLVYGTLMTLIVVPCIYDLMIRDKRKIGGNESEISSKNSVIWVDDNSETAQKTSNLTVTMNEDSEAKQVTSNHVITVNDIMSETDSKEKNRNNSSNGLPPRRTHANREQYTQSAGQRTTETNTPLPRRTNVNRVQVGSASEKSSSTVEHIDSTTVRPHGTREQVNNTLERPHGIREQVNNTPERPHGTRQQINSTIVSAESQAEKNRIQVQEITEDVPKSSNKYADILANNQTK